MLILKASGPDGLSNRILKGIIMWKHASIKLFPPLNY